MPKVLAAQAFDVLTLMRTSDVKQSVQHVSKETKTVEFFLNGAELSLNSVNSEKLINHPSMNWAQFKDPVSHMCLPGAVVASWSLRQEVAGLNPFNDINFLSLNSANSVTKNLFYSVTKTFRKNSSECAVSLQLERRLCRSKQCSDFCE